MNMQDEIIDKLLAVFSDNTIAGNSIDWERIEKYAIDDACRMKKAALGLVDQGQKFGFKASVTDIIWRVAVEFFVRCEYDEDIQSIVNTARADVYRTMMHDQTLGNLVVDVSPVADEIFVARENSMGEGVMLFDIRYRTNTVDIAIGL
jgi:hypothetical protein